MDSNIVVESRASDGFRRDILRGQFGLTLDTPPTSAEDGVNPTTARPRHSRLKELGSGTAADALQVIFVGHATKP